MYNLEFYTTEDGTPVVHKWLTELRDLKARARIMVRLDRAKAGNLGTSKALRDGVYEMKIDYGPGYRVYYALVGATVVLLLNGGDKSRQAKDIERAVAFLADYRRRTS